MKTKEKQKQQKRRPYMAEAEKRHTAPRPSVRRRRAQECPSRRRGNKSRITGGLASTPPARSKTM